MMVLLCVSSLANAQMTKEERDFAVKYMNETAEQLAKAVKGLSEEQMNFKPDANTWSVAECVKHISISEGFTWQIVEGALKTAPDASKRAEVQVTDEQVMMFLEDRSQKVKTFPNLEPQNNTGSMKDAMTNFKKLRKEHVKFIKASKDDLRNRYYEFPFGKTDAYQVLLFISAHTRRHTKQIEEVMANASFPRQ